MEVKVQRIQEISTFTAGGTLQVNVQITFNVGEHGPFTVVIPKTEFDNVRATREIEEIKKRVEATAKIT